MESAITRHRGIDKNKRIKRPWNRECKRESDRREDQNKMSGSSVASKKSYKSYSGENKKAGRYTGDEELKEFTFTIGAANATGRFLKAKNGIAEMAGRKLGDEVYQLMKHGKEVVFKEPAEPNEDKLTYAQQKRYELEYRTYLEEMRQYILTKGSYSEQ